MSQTFFVECYWAERSEAAVRDRVRQVAAVACDLRDEGHVITLLGALLIADDEICFWRFASRSIATVEEAGRRAGLAVDRVMPSIDVAAEHTTAQLIETAAAVAAPSEEQPTWTVTHRKEAAGSAGPRSSAPLRPR